MRSYHGHAFICTLLFSLVTGGKLFAGKTGPGIGIQNLTCEYLANPVGIDKRNPSLIWMMKSDERNWEQSAYQIIVSSNASFLKKNKGDIWNSGKVISNENIQIKYEGKPLLSFMNCYWKVKVWVKDGNESEWSSPAYWKMGILSSDDWKGKWICSDLELKEYQKALRALPDFDMEPEIEI